MKIKGQTTLVVGESRGFGRGVVESLIASGVTVTDGIGKNGGHRSQVGQVPFNYALLPS
jgi:NAD(P)-dependent dehydrogenase (short-subunit alcohol dehydrogenase family)